jgi:hypothetical protein
MVNKDLKKFIVNTENEQIGCNYATMKKEHIINEFDTIEEVKKFINDNKKENYNGCKHCLSELNNEKSFSQKMIEESERLREAMRTKNKK